MIQQRAATTPATTTLQQSHPRALTRSLRASPGSAAPPALFLDSLLNVSGSARSPIISPAVTLSLLMKANTAINFQSHSQGPACLPRRATRVISQRAGDTYCFVYSGLFGCATLAAHPSSSSSFFHFFLFAYLGLAKHALLTLCLHKHQHYLACLNSPRSRSFNISWLCDPLNK